MPRIIDDGHNIELYLQDPGGDHFYALRRPTLPAERGKAQARARRAEAIQDWGEYNAAYNDLMAAKLVWWNVRDADGNIAPITAANAGKLELALWDRLTDVVLGYSWGDLPKNPTPEQKAEFDKAVAAEKAGNLPGDAAAETDAKN